MCVGSVTVSIQGSSEVQLRSCLRVCVSLSRLWPPSLLPVTSAWDYYHRHMVGCLSPGGCPASMWDVLFQYRMTRL